MAAADGDGLTVEEVDQPLMMAAIDDASEVGAGGGVVAEERGPGGGDFVDELIPDLCRREDVVRGDAGLPGEFLLW